VIETSINIGGEGNIKRTNDLLAHYSDSCNMETAWKMTNDLRNHQEVLFELRIKAPGYEHAAELQKEIAELLNTREFRKLYVKPVVRQDGDFLCVGFKFFAPIKDEVTVPDAFTSILANAGQHVHWKVELGSSF